MAQKESRSQKSSLSKVKSFQYNEYLRSRRPTLTSHSVEGVAAKSTRDKLINDIFGDASPPSRDSYIDRSLLPETPQDDPSEAELPPSRKSSSFVRTYPVQSIRWDPRVECFHIDNQETSCSYDQEPILHYRCSDCNRLYSPSTADVSKNKKSFKDNIMTFKDCSTMTPKLMDAGVSVYRCTSSCLKTKTSDVSAVTSDMMTKGESEEDMTLTPKHLPNELQPIINKDFEDFIKHYAHISLSNPKPTKCQSTCKHWKDAPRQAPVIESCSGKCRIPKERRESPCLLVTDRSEAPCIYLPTLYPNEKKIRIPKNEPFCRRGISPTPIPKQKKLKCKTNQQCYVKKYLEQDCRGRIPFSYKTESKYHEKCGHSSKNYVVYDDEPMVLPCNDQCGLLRCRRPRKPSRTAVLPLPRRVLTSQPHIDEMYVEHLREPKRMCVP